MSGADHHPDAADVLERALGYRYHFALTALSAAGLAVVPVGEPPPWMEQPTYQAGSMVVPDVLWLCSDGEPRWYSAGLLPSDGARPLYILRLPASIGEGEGNG